MTFSFSQLALATGLATGALLSSLGTANALAFGFQFGTNASRPVPSANEKEAAQRDILLESVTFGDQTITDFAFVSSVPLNFFNDLYTGQNTGAASADKGDLATGGVKNEKLTAANVVTNLSTNNLNHIIDTEDTGSFTLDLTFDAMIDNLLIWERGKNSDLGVQALDADGKAIGNRLVVKRNMWFDAGYEIDTLEIDNVQEVGSLGINIWSDLGVASGAVSTIRISSEKGFNGPDWKVVGTAATRSVPEPALILGLTLLGGAMALTKRSDIQSA